MGNKKHGFMLLAIVFLLVASTVLVSVRACDSPYDIDHDCDVDIDDIAMVAKAFGSYTGHPRYSVDLDVYPSGFPDGKINVQDICAVAMHFGS